VQSALAGCFRKVPIMLSRSRPDREEILAEAVSA
jgi:hypothetical protein